MIIGARVHHPKHGDGTIASQSRARQHVWVEFDEHQDPRLMGLIEIVDITELTLTVQP